MTITSLNKTALLVRSIAERRIYQVLMWILAPCSPLQSSLTQLTLTKNTIYVFSGHYFSQNHGVMGIVVFIVKRPPSSDVFMLCLVVFSLLENCGTLG